MPRARFRLVPRDESFFARFVPQAQNVEAAAKVLFDLIAEYHAACSSPIGGFLAGLVLVVAIYRLFARARASAVRRFFGKAQIGSAAFMALSHGLNDAQKTMGVITLAVLLDDVGTGSRVPEEFGIPIWVILTAAFVIGCGTMVGGWRVIRTMGLRLTKLEPVNGFAAETGAALVITGAASLGIPISTTHAIGTAIMGVGATKRLSAVRWGVAGQVVAAWILTWPSCMALGYLLGKALGALF